MNSQMNLQTREALEHQALELALDKGQAEYAASESQAIAAGMLVVNIAADMFIWLKLLVGEVDPQNRNQHDAILLLGQLFEQTKQQLQDPNLDFQIMLPDDDEPLAERVNAVQEWSQGFLLGVSMAGIKDIQSLPDDSRDLLVDFATIGASGELEFAEDDIESELALTEIVEYLRMGALLVNEELQPLKSSSIIH